MSLIAHHAGTRAEYLRCRDAARQLVHRQVEHWNQLFQHDYNRIAIRNQRSRWGSCSENRNLNFNYRLLFLPQTLVDYVIVHELAHLKQMNHSDAFWDVVAQAMPEWQLQRRQLRATPIRWSRT